MIHSVLSISSFCQNLLEKISSFYTSTAIMISQKID